MFSGVTCECTGFESSPEPIKEIKDSIAQTHLGQSAGASTQTSFRSNAEVQTNEQSHGGDWPPDYDVELLSSFLKKICPSVLNELSKVSRSKAFDYRDVGRERSQQDAVQLYELQQSNFSNLPKQSQVSCLSWSCTGNVLAIGYAVARHSGWCLHDSAIHFFNISKYEMNTALPDEQLAVNSCVSALAMHPHEPSVVAVGTQLGDVSIWSLGNEGFQERFPNTVQHKNRVTCLVWTNVRNQLQLVSSSMDGYIYSFKVISAIKTVTRTETYLPYSLDSVLVPGILTFAFSNIPDVFVLALEGGELLHCTMSSSSTNDITPLSATPIRQPVLKRLGKELGDVNCIEFSPNVDHVYFTVHIGNIFAVRSLHEEGPLYKIFTNFVVLGAHWLPAHPNFVVTWGNSPRLAVYHVKAGRKVASVNPTGGLPPSKVVLHIAINSKSPSLIATSGAEGDVFLWELPGYFKLE